MSLLLPCSLSRRNPDSRFLFFRLFPSIDRLSCTSHLSPHRHVFLSELLFQLLHECVIRSDSVPGAEGFLHPWVRDIDDDLVSSAMAVDQVKDVFLRGKVLVPRVEPDPQLARHIIEQGDFLQMSFASLSSSALTLPRMKILFSSASAVWETS